MVLRDNNLPKLCFDNPLYNTEGGASRSGPSPKAELKVSKSVSVVSAKPTDHPGAKKRASNMSHAEFQSFFIKDPSTPCKQSPQIFMPAATLTPDCDVEEHIIENIRNRDFWSRRSRNNPFTRLRTSEVRLSKRTSSPAHLLVPGQCLEAEEELQLPSPSTISAADEDEEAIASEMMLESQKETRLRHNITWMRDYLSQVSEADGGTFSLLPFIAAMRNKELLRRLFSLWDVRGDGVLPQEEWVDHLKCSTREVGAREWAELLEVLAYVVCGEDGEVTEDLFTTILTSRGVLEKLFRLINKEGDGLVSRQDIMDFIANLTYARPRTGFTRENLEWLEQLFRQALGHKQELSFDDFKKIVHSRNSFFAERVFQIFDRDNSGTVSLAEFLDAMHQFAGKSPNDKIKFLFRVYDLDGDGLIQQSELQKVMKACMEENGMKFSDEQIEDLTLAMFEDADTQNTGAITYESLKAQLEKHDGLLENLSISIDRWLVPPDLGTNKETFSQKLAKLKPYQLSIPYAKNNYVYLTFLFIYLAINVCLFATRAYEYWNNNTYTILARACGQCLNFNCMFILVFVLRQSITYLRSVGAISFLPLDQHLYLHKLCGWLIFIYSVVHTVMHLINFSTVVIYLTDEGQPNAKNFTLTEWIFTMKPGLFGLVKGIANPTGVALMIILTVMVICSLPFVRKSGYFEVFYWTHLLYVAFWVLTILHGPNFWKWFVGPGVIFVLERLDRFIRLQIRGGKAYIRSGVLLPSKVIHLVIKRPPQFDFRPGDYVFINIPEIAKYEWHPFTISSAPEQDDVVWLHIRAVGQWTNRLVQYFEVEQERCSRQRGEVVVQAGDATELNTMVSDGRRATIIRPRKTSASPLTLSLHDNPSGNTGSKALQENGTTNVAFELDGSVNGVRLETTQSDGEAADPAMTTLETTAPKAPLTGAKNQSSHHFFGGSKMGKKKLVKTRSVPDLTKRLKKREKNLILRDNFRAASARTYEASSLKLAEQPASHTPAPLFSHLLKSTAPSSFRYMRRKPTIITLDTPSEAEDNASYEVEEEVEEHRREVRVTIQEGGVNSSPGTLDMSPLTAESGQVRHKNNQEDAALRTPKQVEQRGRKLSRFEEAMAEGACAVGKPLAIYMDGPFGTPSSHIFGAQHAVLIATGIGVTPFASILQSIMHKYWKARHTCPRCTYSWTSGPSFNTIMSLRKVDFFWINRDQRSFEWFVNLLSQLEIEQAEQGGVLERFLDMHMYITSALQKTDMKAVGLQLALDLLHEKEKRDLITGLKTRTNAGRPNWDKVFKQLQNQQKGKITVFYCGPPALGRTLRYKCHEYGFNFRKEIF
nr:NADPH oxidase 5-like isoform X1 [Procambarus clarkii]XP_045625282.1 NADPH oxidase 5-like isoform X1 [Procambarus clarkii]